MNIEHRHVFLSPDNVPVALEQDRVYRVTDTTVDQSVINNKIVVTFSHYVAAI